MAVLSTRVGEVLDYLLEHMPTFVEVEVSEGWTDMNADRVMLGTVNVDQDWAEIGARKLNQNVTVTVLILTKVDGGTATDARQRAETIFNKFGAVLRTDQTAISLGGICTHAQLRVTSQRSGLTPDGADYLLEAELLASNIRF